MGNTGAHEVGHSLGLVQLGGSNTQLSAIMNTPDQGLNRETWHTGLTHSGENPQPPVTQDDMSIISNATNGFGYRADDHGNTTATATALTAAGTVYTATGVIEQVSADSDFFSFVATSGGTTTITVDVDDYLYDLDAALRVYDSSGTVIGTDSPTGSPDASVTLTLARTAPTSPRW